jgi:rhodanese-related sulfurtransferase
MSSETSSTVAKERATNEALQFRDVQEFVLVSASVSTPRPPTTERVVALNRGPWVAWPDAPQELQATDDATVLDVRPFDDYSAGHIPGAISVSIDGGSFGTKSGFVLMPDERIVLHARSEAEALDAAQKLWAVGILEIAGYVVAPDAPKTLPTLNVDELRALLRHRRRRFAAHVAAAERAGDVARIDPDVVAEIEQATERVVEVFGSFARRDCEIGAGGGADEHRVTGEGELTVDYERAVLGAVAGGVHDANVHLAGGDDLPVLERLGGVLRFGDGMDRDRQPVLEREASVP